MSASGKANRCVLVPLSPVGGLRKRILVVKRLLIVAHRNEMRHLSGCCEDGENSDVEFSAVSSRRLHPSPHMESACTHALRDGGRSTWLSWHYVYYG